LGRLRTSEQKSRESITVSQVKWSLLLRRTWMEALVYYSIVHSSIHTLHHYLIFFYF
jgi:hypothetical protein